MIYGVVCMAKSKKKGLKTAFILTVVIAIIYGLFCSYAVMIRTVHSMAQSQMEQVANEAIHKAIMDASSNGAVYGELVTIYRNDQGSIESLTLNPYAVNSLKSEISLKVLDYLNDSERYVIEVPLGNFFNSDFLSGFGPKVHLKVIPFNVAEIDFESKFTPAGINQVLHTVTVRVDVKIGAILPGFEEISDVSSSAIISEAIIIGDVPETYLEITK